MDVPAILIECNKMCNENLGRERERENTHICTNIWHEWPGLNFRTVAKTVILAKEMNNFRIESRIQKNLLATIV